MALTTPLITAGYVGSTSHRWATLSLIGKAVWTESGALPYTTTKAAPDPLGESGDPVFTVYSPVDVVVAIGAAPNASTGPRYLVPANTEKTFYAQPGDKLAAVAA